MDNIRHGEPSDVIAEQDEVIQAGPGGIVISFEPEAAIETGRRLIAKGQRAAQGRIDPLDEAG